jgi:two-component system sensor histidine kinase/response regulator
LKEGKLIIDVAENGAIAVKMVQEHSYDLVLMDMQMPVMDGVSATQAIRALGGEFAELPIVAMTANAMLSDREACLAAGMNDHLGKPIKPKELWSKLLYWIKPRAVD